jgi:hypothetical protein
MIYRKSPLQPTRLLLKVVAAGAGALVSVACSSNGLDGSVAMPPGGGVVGMPGPDGGDAGCSSGCGDGGEDHIVLGVVPLDGSADATEEPPPGLMVNPEAGDEFDDGPAGLVDGPVGVVDGPVGVVINPEAGSD